MKKRIIALICTLTFLLPCVTVNAYFSDIPDNTKEERILNIIKSLGIMAGYEEEGVRTFKPDQPVTRAEFVTVIRNCINLWGNVEGSDGLGDSSGFDWLKYYLGATDTELEPMYPQGSEEGGEVQVKKLWSDVDESHWAYNNMRDISILGVIKGYPDGTFKPNNTVTFDEAITIILTLCGYGEYAKATGGFPEGYQKLAVRFNLTNGITSTGSMPLSRMEVASLVYNAFTLPLTSPFFGENESRNFLNDIVGVYIVEGTLESTDITSIYGGEVNAANLAIVDNTEFSFDADSDIRDYIGQEIRVFMRKDQYDDYVMKSFEPIGKEEVTVIDISLLEDYAGNTFFYKKSEGSSEKKVEFRRGSKLIYNGKYSSYSADTFSKENLNQGTITVIEKDDYDFDIIVVENLESGYLNNVNSKLFKLTDGLKSQTAGGAAIKLQSDTKEENIFYQILDNNGKKLTIDDLTAGGAINYYQNDDIVKIYYSENEITGTIEASRVEDDKTYLTIDGEEYAISKAYQTAYGNGVRSGMYVKGVVDRYNELVWIESESTSLDGYAYIIKVRKDYENESLIIRYFDLGTKQITETSTVNDLVKFTNASNINYEYDMNTLYDEINGLDNLAKFTIKDGKISKISLALAKETEYDSTDKLKLVMETSNDATSPNYKGNYRYYGDGGFVGKYFINSNTVILSVPEDRTDTDGYTISSSNSLTANGSTHVVKLYTFDEEKPYMNVMLRYSAGASTTSKFHNVASYLVLGRKESINADNEPTTELDLYNISSGETSVVANVQDENGNSIFEKAYDAYMQKNNRKVERGDVIQIAREDIWTGDPVATRIVYDANGVNPAWCCGDATGKPTSCQNGHTPSVLGSIPGGSGYGTHSKNYENPVGYTWGNPGGYEVVQGHREAYQGYILGFVHSPLDDMLRITGQNLKDGFTKEDDNFYWSYWKTAGADVIIYEDGTVTKGNIDDIRTYSEYGSKCDKILTYSYYGTLNAVIVFRD